MGNLDEYMPRDSIPLPPPDAKVVTTACDYCIVGCGYRVFTWPVDSDGGHRASENAFGMDMPSGALRGWVSPNQHNVATIDGQPHHVVVQPDPEADVVNRKGNHSIRGGTLALKLYNPDTPTRDRLKTPLLRVNGELTPISWDDSFEMMARVSKHILDTHGQAAWGMKTYSYEYFENTYTISKLAFRSIGTPAYSPHDKPGPGNDTAGLDDSGIIPFSASFEDWSIADVIFISGTDPFETKTVLFTEWMMSVHRVDDVRQHGQETDIRAAQEDGGCGMGREKRRNLAAGYTGLGYRPPSCAGANHPRERLGGRRVHREVGRQSMGDRRGHGTRHAEYAMAVAHGDGLERTSRATVSGSSSSRTRNWTTRPE